MGPFTEMETGKLKLQLDVEMLDKVLLGQRNDKRMFTQGIDLSAMLQVQTSKNSTVKHQWYIKDGTPNKSKKSKEIIQSTKNVKCDLALRLAKSSTVCD